jgi:leader peptidase (prepilin peptidase)/N-methyltransferase
MFDPKVWAEVPFQFWTLMFFIFGCLVGSFLNVCIHRLPREESLLHPPSHCPNCAYSIPWYLNIPLITWLWLRGRCANCKEPISVRYFLVELLTGLAFAACWLKFGHQSPWLALIYCLVLAGFTVATCIDFEHFIIPDEITFGGIGVGMLCSIALPRLHNELSILPSLKHSALGAAVGGGVVYGILRLGKILFGKQKLEFPPGTNIVFTETSVKLPDQDIPYEEVFYRKTDVITFEARTVRITDRTWENVTVRLSPDSLEIGDQKLDPEQVPHMEVVTDKMVLPREAMGLGDVKFMAAIGAFLGWPGAMFALMLSSIIGALVGGVLILLKKQEWSSKIPYGPYIALAATIWIFGGQQLLEWWFTR